MKYLNLGCGGRHLSDWTNVNFVSHSPSVIAHDLSKGIPFPSETFDVVYHSHLLEHFEKKDALMFMAECFRVLKPGGIIRVVVPDLEQIARIYLDELERCREDNNPVNRANHEWAVIEMYDQTVRRSSGGQMAEFWGQENLVNEDRIVSRVGDEFHQFRKLLLSRSRKSSSASAGVKPSKHTPNWKRFLNLKVYREKLLLLLSGEPRIFEYLEYARFRFGGEIHQWMYDSYSLSVLLSDIGFKNPQVMTAHTSQMNKWDEYQWLDVEEGKVRKPDSLFMEARKP